MSQPFWGWIASGPQVGRKDDSFGDHHGPVDHRGSLKEGPPAARFGKGHAGFYRGLLAGGANNVSISAAQRPKAASKVTREYECACEKAARYASVQELGPTPVRVINWRQADSTSSGSMEKTI